MATRGSTTNQILTLLGHLVAEQVSCAVMGALVRASYVPPQPIRELRDPSPDRSREVQRLEKLLENAGIKLSSVATDIVGVSRRAMLQTLTDGERDPAVLAALGATTMTYQTCA